MEKKFLVISKGIFHPSLRARRNLKNFLTSLDNFSFEFKSSLKDLQVIKRNDSYTGLIFFFHEKTLPDDVWSTIDNYCEDERSIFLIHGAMASFKEHKGYQKMAGGSFKGHGKPGLLEVKGDKISFFLLEELYTHHILEGNRIWLYGKQDSVEEPILWTRDYKKAKIAYFSLGHYGRSFRNENIKTILKNTLDYLSQNKEELV